MGRPGLRAGLLALMCSLMAVAQNAPSTQKAAPANSAAPAPAPTAKAEKTSAASKTVKAESVAINKPEGITHDQADAILSELRAIHQLLATQSPAKTAAPTAPGAPITAAIANDKIHLKIASGWHWMGRDDAPVTIVEFTDYQCPFCRKFHTETFAQLKKNYIDTGKVRFVSRDLPLNIHPNAEKAAEAAWCAGEQNKYWELRDAMIINSADLSPDAIVRYALVNAIDIPSFKACTDAEKYKAEIKQGSTDAAAFSINGTPSFVIGKTATDVIDGDRVVGALPVSTFESEIQKFMTK